MRQEVPLGLRVLQLVIGTIGYSWSTVFLLTDDDPSPYVIALGLSVSVLLGVLLANTYRAWRTRG